MKGVRKCVYCGVEWEGGSLCCVQFKSWVEEKECLSLVFKMRPLLYVLTSLMVAASHVINPITATRAKPGA